MEPVLVQMDSHGRLVLPRGMRGKGKQYFTCQAERDGTLHLLRVVGVITTKQAYFWTKRWQQGEKQASQALRKGQYRVVPPEKLDSFLNSL